MARNSTLYQKNRLQIIDSSSVLRLRKFKICTNFKYVFLAKIRSVCYVYNSTPVELAARTKKEFWKMWTFVKKEAPNGTHVLVL